MSLEEKKKMAAVAGAAGAALLAYGLNQTYSISSDISQIRHLLKVKSQVDAHLKNNTTFADVWEEALKKTPKKVAIMFEGKEYTYEQIDKLANQVARWIKARGHKVQEVIALCMENRAEYVAIWLGVLKAGLVCALINCNLKGKPLLHSLTISKAKTVIIGSECLEQVGEISSQLQTDGWSMFSFGGASSFAPAVEADWAKQSDKQLPRSERAGVKFTDVALLVYTSGTTGLPKAATLRHLRTFTMGYAFVTRYNIQSSDRIYCVLPLYHSAGGVVGVGMMINANATLVLKRKFSNREFWADCRQNKCTVIQYIGELCRYLLAAPVDKLDGKNSVRIAIGNGLRPDIWTQFQTRFNINEIGEFYGSTEGNAALFGHCIGTKGRGTVGHMGPLLKKASQLKVVKFDVQKEEPVRDKNGFCVECAAGEVGELLGEIVDNDPIRGFAGYYGNQAATNSKVMADVFKKGDKYFRTGDLMKHDQQGYWHFVDRIGDTFRWKGENVSTTEVAEVCSTFPGVEEANVYGVEVPHGDGRACMVAMVLKDNNFDFKGFAAHCAKNLPTYAMPMFLRLLPRIEVTGTFKHQKVELRNEGCIPDKCLSNGKKDPLLKYAEAEKTFKPFVQADYEALKQPRSKL